MSYCMNENLIIYIHVVNKRIPLKNVIWTVICSFQVVMNLNAVFVCFYLRNGQEVVSDLNSISFVVPHLRWELGGRHCGVAV